MRDLQLLLILRGVSPHLPRGSREAGLNPCLTCKWRQEVAQNCILKYPVCKWVQSYPYSSQQCLSPLQKRIWWSPCLSHCHWHLVEVAEMQPCRLPCYTALAHHTSVISHLKPWECWEGLMVVWLRPSDSWPASCLPSSDKISAKVWRITRSDCNSSWGCLSPNSWLCWQTSYLKFTAHIKVRGYSVSLAERYQRAVFMYINVNKLCHRLKSTK